MNRKIVATVLLAGLSLIGLGEAIPFSKLENLSSNSSNVDIEELIASFKDQLNIESVNDFTNSLNLDNETRIDPDLYEDARLLTPGLIQKRGYPVETHVFVNDDGYYIEMHRIPGNPSSPSGAGKQPVLLMHGLLDSSATWVLMGPQQGLGYLLADQGYDVWMGNVRGNRYSRDHVQHNPDGWRGNRRKFWEFTFHEMGMVDVPNMIDYITRQTGFQRMHYVGHSQGTTCFFIMTSQRPEYNDRIISAHALAPVAFMGNIKNPFLRLAVLTLNTIDIATSVLGMYEFLPNSYIFTLLGQVTCQDEAFTQAICSNILFLIAGFNSNQLNATMIPVIMGHTPSGSSTDQMIHFGQLIKSGRFGQYSYGPVTNLIKYGSISPPSYNLRNIRAPVALYYSPNDWLADDADVVQLQRELPNVIQSIVPDPRFNHFDFIWGTSARPLLYNKSISPRYMWHKNKSISILVDKLADNFM